MRKSAFIVTTASFVWLFFSVTASGQFRPFQRERLENIEESENMEDSSFAIQERIRRDKERFRAGFFPLPIEIVPVWSRIVKEFYTLRLDVRFRNRDDSPKWFFIPVSYSPFEENWQATPDYKEVSVDRYGGQGNIIVSEFYSDSAKSSYAVFLPGKKEVILRNVPVSYHPDRHVAYSENSGEFETRLDNVLPIVTMQGRQFTANGEPLESWLGVDSLGDSWGEADYENYEETLLVKRDLSNVELRLTMEDRSRFVLRIDRLRQMQPEELPF